MGEIIMGKKEDSERPVEKVAAWRPQGKIILETGHSVDASARSQKRKPLVAWGGSGAHGRGRQL